MNKAVTWLKILKWACFPLGWIMYTVTKDAVGDFWSVVLGTAATVSFWMIVRREETVQMEKSIAAVIQDAILRYNGAGNAVEVRRIRSGAVARVYVMGDEATMNNLLDGMQKAISLALKQADLTHRVWVLQMTTVGSEQDIPEKREILNRQMVKDLNTIMKKRQERDQQENRDGKE